MKVFCTKSANGYFVANKHLMISVNRYVYTSIRKMPSEQPEKVKTTFLQQELGLEKASHISSQSSIKYCVREVAREFRQSSFTR